MLSVVVSIAVFGLVGNDARPVQGKAVVTESIGTWVTRGRTELRLSTADLACAAELAEDRVATIEEDRGDGTLYELGQLSKVLGYDLAGWDPEEEPAPRPLPTVQTLCKSTERTPPVDQWPRVLEIAEVAREIARLEHLLGLPDRRASLRRGWPPDGTSEHDPTSDEAFSPLHHERRGTLLDLTLRAFAKGLISRSRALELLRVDGDVFAKKSDDWARRLGIAR